VCHLKAKYIFFTRALHIWPTSTSYDGKFDYQSFQIESPYYHIRANIFNSIDVGISIPKSCGLYEWLERRQDLAQSKVPHISPDILKISLPVRSEFSEDEAAHFELK
jgi:hypothetical protein